mgnify:CR=1 FL=1
MKKLSSFIFFLLAIFTLFLIIYFIPKNYKNSYNVDGYNITEKYDKKDKIYSFILQNENGDYVYAVKDKYYNKHRQISKIIKENNLLKIKTYDIDDFYIYKDNNEYKSIYYNENFEKNAIDNFKNIDIYEYKANYYIWNYTGFININKKNKEIIKLFEKDLYDIDLVYTFDNYILVADYSNKYYFNKMHLLNTSNNKIKVVNLDSNVYFNSYFLGKHKKYIYLYDMQENIEYKINPFKNFIQNTSYGIYDNNSWKKISKNKLDKGNVSFIIKKDFYYQLDNEILYYVTPVNRIKITDMKVSKIVKSDDNNCYFISNDSMYYADKNNISKLLSYSEWNFNYSNIYVFD